LSPNNQLKVYKRNEWNEVVKSVTPGKLFTDLTFFGQWTSNAVRDLFLGGPTPTCDGEAIDSTSDMGVNFWNVKNLLKDNEVQVNKVFQYQYPVLKKGSVNIKFNFLYEYLVARTIAVRKALRHPFVANKIGENETHVLFIIFFYTKIYLPVK